MAVDRYPDAKQCFGKQGGGSGLPGLNYVKDDLSRGVVRRGRPEEEPYAKSELRTTAEETGQLLRTLISKPEMSRELLEKPPVKFIRDVFKELCAVTDFGRGLFDEQELRSCSSSREAKFRFLAALLCLVATTTRDPHLPLRVRIDKVAAGLEPIRTNRDLLQNLYRAATSVECRERWEPAVKAARSAWEVLRRIPHIATWRLSSVPRIARPSLPHPVKVTDAAMSPATSEGRLEGKGVGEEPLCVRCDAAEIPPAHPTAEAAPSLVSSARVHPGKEEHAVEGHLRAALLLEGAIPGPTPQLAELHVSATRLANALSALEEELERRDRADSQTVLVGLSRRLILGHPGASSVNEPHAIEAPEMDAAPPMQEATHTSTSVSSGVPTANRVPFSSSLFSGLGFEAPPPNNPASGERAFQCRRPEDGLEDGLVFPSLSSREGHVSASPPSSTGRPLENGALRKATSPMMEEQGVSKRTSSASKIEPATEPEPSSSETQRPMASQKDSTVLRAGRRRTVDSDRSGFIKRLSCSNVAATDPICFSPKSVLKKRESMEESVQEPVLSTGPSGKKRNELFKKQMTRGTFGGRTHRATEELRSSGHLDDSDEEEIRGGGLNGKHQGELEPRVEEELQGVSSPNQPTSLLDADFFQQTSAAKGSALRSSRRHTVEASIPRPLRRHTVENDHTGFIKRLSATNVSSLDRSPRSAMKKHKSMEDPNTLPNGACDAPECASKLESEVLPSNVRALSASFGLGRVTEGPAAGEKSTTSTIGPLRSCSKSVEARPVVALSAGLETAVGTPGQVLQNQRGALGDQNLHCRLDKVTTIGKAGQENDVALSAQLLEVKWGHAGHDGDDGVEVSMAGPMVAFSTKQPPSRQPTSGRKGSAEGGESHPGLCGPEDAAEAQETLVQSMRRSFFAGEVARRKSSSSCSVSFRMEPAPLKSHFQTHELSPQREEPSQSREGGLITGIVRSRSFSEADETDKTRSSVERRTRTSFAAGVDARRRSGTVQHRLSRMGSVDAPPVFPWDPHTLSTQLWQASVAPNGSLTPRQAAALAAFFDESWVEKCSE